MALAGATGLAAGALIELPAAGVLGMAVAAAAARRAVGSDSGPRGARLAGAAVLGVGAAAATTRVWPVAPRTPEQVQPALATVEAEASQRGDGLVVVVNVQSGGGGEGPAEFLRRELPEARVVEVDGDGLDAALREAASTCRVLGIAGGDGSVSAAAAAAGDADVPLLVVPGGTLNHLARDLGVAGPEDAVAALRAGRAVAVDLATIDGRTFVNTASFGAYSALVDGRERLEGRIGKWPAMVVALGGVLRSARPVEIELNGRPRSLWMIFVGNCRYHPAGFAPTWRERLDDGRLDVRLVDAASPWARARLLLAVLTGRLGRCRVYEAFTARELRVRSLDGPMRLARDGETFAGSAEFDIAKVDRPVVVYVPPVEGQPFKASSQATPIGA
ncbi:MAG: hypothetical protein QOK43_2582 [Acidimicrobiaceae bacterium]|nr:hypothetical protein [Acidimicrobiaceae bacterium]